MMLRAPQGLEVWSPQQCGKRPSPALGVRKCRVDGEGAPWTMGTPLEEWQVNQGLRMGEALGSRWGVWA